MSKIQPEEGVGLMVEKIEHDLKRNLLLKRHQLAIEWVFEIQKQLRDLGECPTGTHAVDEYPPPPN